MLRNKIVLAVFALLINLVTFAQSSKEIVEENEGVMRSEGKIYVVLAIVLTILAGLFLYIIRLDRKISKLEKGDL